MTQDVNSASSGKDKKATTGTDGLNVSSLGAKRDDSSLWTEKHAPQTIDELVINKKKVQEFIELVESHGGGGFLVLHGAPGSCKNALIRTYCQ